ncbi:high affinity immunoglobulin gamma Fc receptor I-like [Notolabrus celidotus]|uniref:high affinity immunoglobulin gamma Fc receptor I-like n=1 Tax=Notolabrus celidotus TaxID=1203425 RepID=UPI00148F8505|nr:high affinity immunoglobulin gamma Fc receptor I-like [Notolabrus celidotus]
MKVAAFHFGLLMTAFMQLGNRPQRVDAAFWIIPTKLQVFEYESLSFQCIGATGWKIVRKTKANTSSCGFSKWGILDEFSCTIKDAFQEDSGAYWCEAEGGERSSSVNVTVTAAPVVLESPAHPVLEGETVIIRCRSKLMSSNLTAEFYKNGLFIGRSLTSEMTLLSVSTCDKGLYKCKIREESAESWLAVRAQHQESHSSSDVVFVFFRNVLPVVMMIPLLLLLGILNGWKFRGFRCRTDICLDCVKI